MEKGRNPSVNVQGRLGLVHPTERMERQGSQRTVKRRVKVTGENL